jgi:CubicO group peptidase (beta-lactamase class C family)
MALRLRSLAALLLLGACASSTNPALAPPRADARQPATTKAAVDAASASPELLPADTAVATPGGSTFTASKGWYLTRAKDRVVVEDPERAVRMTLVEVDDASAAGAIARAWKLVDPAFARQPRETSSPPATDGWDEITQTVYATRDEEARVVVAIAQRKGTKYYVTLLDGQKGPFDKRYAQVITSVRSFRAKGVKEESFAGRTAHRLEGTSLHALESFIEQARVDAKVPGLAVAVVQDGKVILERGFGQSEQGQSAPVTPQTLFMIGSTTKSLTTLMMARLVDAKKLGWDSPLAEVLPSFALGDPALTPKVTMRHTVCACTGMPRRDLELILQYAGVSPEARMAELRTMKPTTGFGETFQYSNLLVAAGGFGAAHAFAPNAKLGAAYEAALKAEVTGPLGMTATTARFDEARRIAHASPHGETWDGRMTPLALGVEEGVVSVAPAGAVWSNLRDMEKVLLVELANGKLATGERFVSEASLGERRKPQVKITDDMSYGLGLFLERDHGVTVLGHGGNNLGFTSDMFFLPEHGVGVVLLSNSGGSANAVRAALRRRILEALFDGKPQATEMMSFALARRKEARAKENAKVRPTPEAAWAAPWLGTYVSPELGAITLRRDGTKVSADVGEWKSAAGQQVEDDGTVKWVFLDPPMVGLELAPKNVAGKPSLSIETPQHTYVFERR